MERAHKLRDIRGLIDALEEIKDEDSHVVTKGEDFDVELGFFGYKAEKALREYRMGDKG